MITKKIIDKELVPLAEEMWGLIHNTPDISNDDLAEAIQIILLKAYIVGQENS